MHWFPRKFIRRKEYFQFIFQWIYACKTDGTQKTKTATHDKWQRWIGLASHNSQSQPLTTSRYCCLSAHPATPSGRFKTTGMQRICPAAPSVRLLKWLKGIRICDRTPGLLTRLEYNFYAPELLLFMKLCILDLILGITRSQETIRGVFNKNKWKNIISVISRFRGCAPHA
jgi:hypothetical protein